jgi:hypothetical protein
MRRSEKRAGPPRIWQTPQWWIILWMSWGLVLAVLSFRFDASPLFAGLWLGAGAFFGLVVPSAFRSFLTPLLEWYHSRILGTNWPSRLYGLVREEATRSDEFERSIDEEVFVGTLAAVPLVALFYGVLISPIVGALWRPNVGISAAASVGAALGLLVGPALLSTLSGLLIACVYRSERRLPLRVQLSRRGLMAISSFLIIPAVWHSLTSIAKRG